MADILDNTWHYPRYKCMNCNVYVESSIKGLQKCPNCWVEGTLVKDSKT